jgi:hypothetical protein
MAGIEFDRQSFVRTGQPNRGSTLPVIGLLIVALAIGGAGYISYKLIVSAPSAPTPAEDVQVLDQMRQQIAKFDERIEQLEKYRKSVARETRAVPQKPGISDPVRATGPGYQFNARSALPSQSSSRNSSGSVSRNVAAFAAETAANREAWQATTNRLADVVDVVGSQQGELSETREAVNRILAKTVRNALPFELRRGAVREPVGPLSLVLKHADVKSQRYTVCVYVKDKCLELKNRSVNEVVSFVTADNSAPLALVATKIMHDQIVGYLEVPAANHP